MEDATYCLQLEVSSLQLGFAYSCFWELFCVQWEHFTCSWSYYSHLELSELQWESVPEQLNGLDAKKTQL